MTDITAMDENMPVGLTANSFTSVSLGLNLSRFAFANHTSPVRRCFMGTLGRPRSDPVRLAGEILL